MPSNATVTTPFSAEVKREAVIAALHNHDTYIRTTCPQLVDYKTVSGTAGVGKTCVYEVTDKKPIGTTTFTLSLTNLEDGVSANIDGKSPTGALNIQSKWVVYADRIEETVSIDANMLMNKMIKGNVEKSHPEQHLSFVKAAC